MYWAAYSVIYLYQKSNLNFRALYDWLNIYIRAATLENKGSGFRPPWSDTNRTARALELISDLGGRDIVLSK